MSDILLTCVSCKYCNKVVLGLLTKNSDDAICSECARVPDK